MLGRRLATISQFLTNVEARDNICRAIQYVAKFSSEGKGVAHDIDSSTTLARKVFRLLKSINELESLLGLSDLHDHHLLLEKSSNEGDVVLGPSDLHYHHWPMMFYKSKHAFMATYFALDNLVWAGKVGLFKDKKHVDLISKISLYFFVGGCTASSIAELYQLIVLIRKGDLNEAETHRRRENVRGFIKSSMDIVVGIGLLQLSPKRVTPRVIGAFGFITSLITCYELLLAADAEVEVKILSSGKPEPSQDILSPRKVEG